ncbi:MAG TPA: amidohydrolase family protein, partial [Flavobacterium sp.]|nr:amidohydrolase family protein [Flavobacterium sp.]
RGQLKEGFLADFALLSDDYFQTDAEKIKSIEAELTVVNGTIVYGAGDFKQLGPAIPAALPDWSPVNTYGGYQN